MPLTASAGVPASASVTASAALIDTPVLTSVPVGQSYTVQVGDTLWGIAARMGTTIDSLVAANHIADPNLIYAGQNLLIPGRVAVTVSAAPAPSRQSVSSGATFSGGGGTYTVRAGDTLWSIANRYGTTVSALAERNHLADPNLIYAGRY